MLNMNTVFLNGEFTTAEQAKVSVFDRGFLFGDGVYEVIPVYAGHCFRLDQHLRRLQHSLDSIKIVNNLSELKWQNIIEQLVEYNGGGNQSIYLQVTRGVAPRDHIFPKAVTPTTFAMSNSWKTVPDTYKGKGITAITMPDIRWQNCHIKAITLLPNSLLKQQAQDAGAQEALLIKDGYLTEGSTSNVYVIIDGDIHTAPINNKILPGITRSIILELAAKANIKVLEQAVSEQSLREADEIWISSSTKEILPVTILNGLAVGLGTPGTTWVEINMLYQQYKTKEICNFGEIQCIKH